VEAAALTPCRGKVNGALRLDPEGRCTFFERRVRFVVAKDDDVFWIEGDNEVIAVAPKCHQPFRTLDAGGQLNLFNHSASISVLTTPELPVEIV